MDAREATQRIYGPLRPWLRQALASSFVGWRTPSADRLEVVARDVAPDLASEGGALQVKVAEVEADEDARQVDVLDDVVKSIVGVDAVRLREARRRGS